MRDKVRAFEPEPHARCACFHHQHSAHQETPPARGARDEHATNLAQLGQRSGQDPSAVTLLSLFLMQVSFSACPSLKETTSFIILAQQRRPTGHPNKQQRTPRWYRDTPSPPLPFSWSSCSRISQFHRPHHRDVAEVPCDWCSFGSHVPVIKIFCEVIAVVFVALGYRSS